jgi:lipopolysaccharide/colanic/teichoic acid biosynthesis glycosyltransferase
MKNYRLKRALDFAIASSAFLAFAPIAAPISIAIWCDDRGTTLFSQPRVGNRRGAFTIIKFRSMRNDKVTRVGAWLRRTGIDEWPQFVNVWRGDMSVVGPRPLTAGDIDRLGWNDAAHDWRFSVKPGITGLSQLLAGRGSRASERLDKLYLKHQSLSLDLRLIALSFAANILGKRKIRGWLARSRMHHQPIAGP